ncbi:MAG: KdsC family phosphatase [Pirellulales bacterium]
MKLSERCQPIELLLSDIDGVLTDGGVILNNQGIESKEFNIRDGLGIRLFQRAGGKFGLVTGRSSHVVKTRAAELEIELIRQGVEDKLAAVKEIAAESNLELRQIAYIGDDLPDLAVLMQVGLGVAVGDACPEMREAAAYVTALPGGRGAVRETIELILKSQQKWDEIIRKYQG